MADGSGYGKRNPWQLEKSTYKHEAHPFLKKSIIFIEKYTEFGIIPM
jgi:hypothetical protein